LAPRLIAITAAVVVAMSSAASTRPLPQDRILGTIDVGAGTPVGINASNDVALVQGYRSYFWTEWGGLTDLGGFDPLYPQTARVRPERPR
jgi:hypothetical protein